MTNLVAIVTVTAYCACLTCCGPKGCGITASGVRPVQGRTCAANWAPFGTKLRIEGVGERIVQDRMARRFSDRVDIYFGNRKGDHERALRFGKRTAKVKVLR